MRHLLPKQRMLSTLATSILLVSLCYAKDSSWALAPRALPGADPAAGLTENGTVKSTSPSPPAQSNSKPPLQPTCQTKNVYKSSDRFFVVFPSPRGWDYLQMEASSAPLQLKFGETFDDSPVACPTVLTREMAYGEQLYCGKSAQGTFSCDDSKAAIKDQAWTFDLTTMTAADGTIAAIFLKESAGSVKYVVLPVQEVGPGLVRGYRPKVEYSMPAGPQPGTDYTLVAVHDTTIRFQAKQALNGTGGIQLFNGATGEPCGITGAAPTSGSGGTFVCEQTNQSPTVFNFEAGMLSSDSYALTVEPGSDAMTVVSKVEAKVEAGSIFVILNPADLAAVEKAAASLPAATTPQKRYLPPSAAASPPSSAQFQQAPPLAAQEPASSQAAAAPPVGPIVGGVAGGLAGLAIISALVYFFVIKGRQDDSRDGAIEVLKQPPQAAAAAAAYHGQAAAAHDVEPAVRDVAPAQYAAATGATGATAATAATGNPQQQAPQGSSALFFQAPAASGQYRI